MDSDLNTTTKRQPDRRAFGEQRFVILLAFVIMWVAITGYYIGIKAPMHPAGVSEKDAVVDVLIEMPSTGSAVVIPATSYEDMAESSASPNQSWTTRLAMLKQEPYDLYAEIRIDDAAKQSSLEQRETLRAFNGAPPMVPHAIDQMTSRGCLACHGEGIKTKSLRAAKMPHPYYANCTQCHVEHTSSHLPSVVFRANEFTGLAAPQSGDRAFANAPPVMPHATMLRNDCLSCHGRTASAGMATTHPWRQNCLQCHGSSSQLEQANLATTPQFLPPHNVVESDLKESDEQ